MSKKCPYKIGDEVQFTPSKRTQGLYQDIEKFGLQINQVATIEEIRDGVYLYFSGKKGGFPWNEFIIVQKDSDQDCK